MSLFKKSSPSPPRGDGEARRGLPGWKKVLLTAAAFFLLSGAGLKAYAWLRGGSGPGTTTQKVVTDQRNVSGAPGNKSSLKPGPGNSLVGEPGTVPREGSPPFEGEAEEKKTTVDEWSPTLVKGGMSFFFGFCIGYALRQFFKVSAFVVGLVLLAIFGLSYAGVIPPPDWTAIQAHFDRIVAALREEGSQFKTFIQGNLPSAGMAGAGLFTGFKRN